MELQQFIRDTLVGIAHGVEEARLALVDTTAHVNPRLKETGPIYDHPIEFDVAVTAGESHEGKVGGGIKVMGLGVDGSDVATSTSEVVSRIRFTIHMVLPDEEVNVTVHSSKSRV